jgi:hypothetical protein
MAKTVCEREISSGTTKRGGGGGWDSGQGIRLCLLTLEMN